MSKGDHMKVILHHARMALVQYRGIARSGCESIANGAKSMALELAEAITAAEEESSELDAVMQLAVDKWLTPEQQKEISKATRAGWARERVLRLLEDLQELAESVKALVQARNRREEAGAGRALETILQERRVIIALKKVHPECNTPPVMEGGYVRIRNYKLDHLEGCVWVDNREAEAVLRELGYIP